jgi:hypothetical protein
MTSEQHGPTDEILDHGNKLPDDDPAAGGTDRGLRNPDDTEGHSWRAAQDTEAKDEDQVSGDVEGHGGKRSL